MYTDTQVCQAYFNLNSTLMSFES